MMLQTVFVTSITLLVCTFASEAHSSSACAGSSCSMEQEEHDETSLVQAKSKVGTQRSATKQYTENLGQEDLGLEQAANDADAVEALPDKRPRQEPPDNGIADSVELTSAERTAATNRLAMEETAAADAVRAAAAQEELAEVTLDKAASVKKLAEKRLYTAVEEQALEAKIAAMKAEQKLKEIREATQDVSSLENVAEAQTGATAGLAADQASALTAATEAAADAKSGIVPPAGVTQNGPMRWWNPERKMGGLANSLNNVVVKYLPAGIVEPFHATYKSLYQGWGGGGGMKDFMAGMIGGTMMGGGPGAMAGGMPGAMLGGPAAGMLR